MDPINKIKENCTPTSSNCVKWPAVDLEGLGICRDSSVTEVIIALNEKLKNIADNLNIDTYELNCLGLEKCGPQEFADLVQLIINKICAIEDGGGVDLSTMKMALYEIGCDIFPDGEYTIPQFAEIVAKEICNINTTITTLQKSIQNIEENIEEINGKVENLQTSKQNNLIFEGHSDANTYLNEVTDWYEKSKEWVGDIKKLTNSSIQRCNEVKRLSGEGEIQWNGDPKNFIDNINYIYTMLCDVRTAVKNLKQNSKSTQFEMTAFLTCDYLYYKGTFVDSYGSSIIIDSTKVYDITINGITIPDYNTLLVLDGNQQFIQKSIIGISDNIDTSVQGKVDITYTVDGVPVTVTKVFTIEPALTNVMLELNNNVPTITFNKNINCRKVDIKYLDKTYLDVASAGKTGSVSFELDQLEEGEEATYYVKLADDSNPSCYQVSAEYVYPDPVKPTIGNGGYDENADDSNIINTVPNDDYTDWYNLLNS